MYVLLSFFVAADADIHVMLFIVVHSLYFRWKRSLWRADFWQANKAEEDVKVQSFITLSQSFITLSLCLPGVRQCAPCWHKMPRQLKLWC